MIDHVEIKSSDGAACLTLSKPEAIGGGGELEYFTAVISDASLRATSRVYAYGAANLADLFEDIAQNWRGWEGEKIGGSTEGDFHLVCTSDRLGHTFVRAVLLSGRYEHDWRAEVTIQLDAAQLDGIAKRLRQFLGPTER